MGHCRIMSSSPSRHWMITEIFHSDPHSGIPALDRSSKTLHLLKSRLDPRGFSPITMKALKLFSLRCLKGRQNQFYSFLQLCFIKKVSEKEHVLSHKFQGWSGRERSAPGSEHSKPANPQKWPFIQEFRSLRDVFLVWVWSLGPRWRGYLSRYPTKRWASVSEGADISLVQIQLLDYCPFRPQTDSMTLSFENGGF